jgi:hypothetical protein
MTVRHRPTCSVNRSTSWRRGFDGVVPAVVRRDEPLHILVDSTGLKIEGEGKWLEQKHGVRPRRRWRKLHLAIEADTREIVGPS